MIGLGPSLVALHNAITIHRSRLWKINRDDNKDLNPSIGVSEHPSFGSKELRFTDWVRPIWYEGQQYAPSAGEQDGGAEGSNVRAETGLTETTSSLTGIVSSSTIRNEDLVAGRYRGARITEYVVDPFFPFLGTLRPAVWFCRGTRWNGEQWEFDIQGLSTKLLIQRGNIVTRTCRHELFAGICGQGLTRSEWQVQAQVSTGLTPTTQEFEATLVYDGPNPDNAEVIAVTVGNPTTIEFAAAHNFTPHQPIKINGIIGSGTMPGLMNALHPRDTWEIANSTTINVGVATTGGYTSGGEARNQIELDWLRAGRVVFDTNAANADVEVVIRSNSQSTTFDATPSTMTVQLLEPLPISPVFGDVMTLEAGCLLRKNQDCEAKFRNTINFGGQDETVGTDRFLDTPEAS
jgi:hypothetical protein